MQIVFEGAQPFPVLTVSILIPKLVSKVDPEISFMLPHHSPWDVIFVSGGWMVVVDTMIIFLFTFLLHCVIVRQAKRLKVSAVQQISIKKDYTLK